MNQCLRCNESCATQAVYCDECRAYLRNRLRQKEETSEELESSPKRYALRPASLQKADSGSQSENSSCSQTAVCELMSLPEVEKSSKKQPLRPLLPERQSQNGNGSIHENTDELQDVTDDDTEIDKIGRHIDPLTTRRLPNSIEGMSIEEEDIRRAIAQEDTATIQDTPVSRSSSRPAAIRSRWITPLPYQSVRTRRVVIGLALVVLLALMVDGLLLALDLKSHLHVKAVLDAPILTLSSSTAHAGQIVLLHLYHFPASARVLVTHDIEESVRTDIGSPFVRLGTSGDADVHILVEDAWGTGFHMIEAEDVATHYTASATLQVLGDVSVPPPQLRISSSWVNMGSDLEGANTIQSLELENTGGSWISWVAKSNQPWLLVAPVRGLFRSRQSIFIGVSRAQLHSGNYTGAITFISNAGIPDFVRVSMTVLPLSSSSAAVLSITPPVLSFTTTDGDSGPPSQVLTISNPGAQLLNWSLTSSNFTEGENQSIPVEYDGNWLSTDTTSGSVAAHSTQSISVLVQSSNLLPGVYSGIFTFTSGQDTVNTPQAVAVSLTVQPQCGVATNLGNLSFTTGSNLGNTSKQLLGLSTTVGCMRSVNWQSYTSENWLSVMPARGTLPENANTLVTVGVNGDTLQPGTYTGFLVFLTSQRTQTVMVQLTVLASSAPPSTAVVEQPTGQCIPSLRMCTSPLPGTPFPTSGFGTPFPTPGPGTPIPTPDPGTTPTPTPPSPGTPTPTLSPLPTPPPAPPILNMGPLNLNFSVSQGSANPPGQAIVLNNAGGSPLYWQMSVNWAGAPWLGLAPLGGTVDANSSRQASVNVNTNGIGVGTYSTQVTVTATDRSGMQVQGSPQVLTVTLTVVQPCSLQVTPTSLSFTASLIQPYPAGQSIMLRESGGCAFPVYWTASGDANWILLSASSGTDNGGSTIVVHVSSKGKLLGSYTGHITLSATDNNGTKLQNSPRVTVTMTVLG